MRKIAGEESFVKRSDVIFDIHNIPGNEHVINRVGSGVGSEVDNKQTIISAANHWVTWLLVAVGIVFLVCIIAAIVVCNRRSREDASSNLATFFESVDAFAKYFNASPEAYSEIAAFSKLIDKFVEGLNAFPVSNLSLDERIDVAVDFCSVLKELLVKSVLIIRSMPIKKAIINLTALNNLTDLTDFWISIDLLDLTLPPSSIKGYSYRQCGPLPFYPNYTFNKEFYNVDFDYYDAKGNVDESVLLKNGFCMKICNIFETCQLKQCTEKIDHYFASKINILKNLKKQVTMQGEGQAVGEAAQTAQDIFRGLCYVKESLSTISKNIKNGNNFEWHVKPRPCCPTPCSAYFETLPFGPDDKCNEDEHKFK